MMKQKKKMTSSGFLLLITIVLFFAMYAAGMVIFADKGFAKPQMFLNLFCIQCRSSGYLLWTDDCYDHRRY